MLELDFFVLRLVDPAAADLDAADLAGVDAAAELALGPGDDLVDLPAAEAELDSVAREPADLVEAAFLLLAADLAVEALAPVLFLLDLAGVDFELVDFALVDLVLPVLDRLVLVEAALAVEALEADFVADDFVEVDPDVAPFLLVFFAVVLLVVFFLEVLASAEVPEPADLPADLPPDLPPDLLEDDRDEPAALLVDLVDEASEVLEREVLVFFATGPTPLLSDQMPRYCCQIRSYAPLPSVWPRTNEAIVGSAPPCINRLQQLRSSPSGPAHLA